MNLKKFKDLAKNKSMRKILVSIFLFLLLIGGILIYRSYAVYQEEETFDVLRGQIPDFSEQEFSGTLMAYQEGEAFWGQKANVTKIVLENKLEPKAGAAYTYDVSAKQDRTVMSYLVTNVDHTEENPSYTLYIQGDGKIDANRNSSHLFEDFKNVESIEGIKYLNTSKVTDMGYMFARMSNLTNLDLSNFNTSKVTDMSYMFARMSNLTNLDLSNFSTSNVTNMHAMFDAYTGANNVCGGNLTTLDISSFDTSNVTDMVSMFLCQDKIIVLDLSHFDTSKVTDMGYMFHGMSSLTALDLSNFNTSNVTNMNSMFNGMSSMTNLNLSTFNTINTTDMSSMFQDMHGLKQINFGSNFITSNVTNMSAMFWSNLVLENLDLSKFDTSKVTNMYGMFYNSGNLTNLDISNFSINQVTNMSLIFDRLPSSAKIYVKDGNVQSWVLNTPDRPSSWTTSNVIIKKV